MRPARITAAVLFAATVGMLTLLAAPAWAAPVSIAVSPSPVAAGHAVVVSGSVGPDAAGSECASSVTLLSKAFVHTHDFAGVPAVFAAVKPDGTFTARTTIPRAKAAGTYTISGRCGGGNLGVSATLVVRAAPTTPPADIRVSPSSVAAGDTVTLSGSVGPDAAGSECASSVTLLSKAFVHTHDFAGVPAVFAAVKPDGTFTARTTIPRAKAAGTYTISGRCGGGNLGASATLAVRAAASPTTTPAPTPPATGPSVIQSAPVATGPTTPAAAQPASRWIIPWLAALGSATVAALGGWLLYRRRHPAGPSRQGRSRMAN